MFPTVFFQLLPPERFYAMKSRPGTYFVTVLEDVNTGKIVGAATLVLELKFIHGCNQVGKKYLAIWT